MVFVILRAACGVCCFYIYRIFAGETGEGRIESNDNPADSIGKVKTSSGDDEQMYAVNISNDIIKDGVSNTQNQQRLINSK